MTNESKEISIFDNIKTDIAKLGDEFEMMLPSHIDKDKFVMTVVTAIQRNKDLMAPEIDKPSLYMSCMESAQDGLIPNGKEAALVTFNTNIGTKRQPKYIKKVQYMPMIQGLRKLVERSGQIKKWTIQVVKEGDLFEYELGDNEFIKHVPGKKRGKTTHAYSIAHLRSGEISREVMDIDQLNDIRTRSKNATNAIWNLNTDEMHRKTVGHRHYKQLPSSPDIDQFMQRWEGDFDLDRDPEPRIINEDNIPEEDISQDPDDDAPPVEGDIIVSGENEVVSLIEGCSDMEVLTDLLRDVNNIKDFQQQKEAHKAWMKRKSELEVTA